MIPEVSVYPSCLLYCVSSLGEPLIRPFRPVQPHLLPKDSQRLFWDLFQPNTWGVVLWETFSGRLFWNLFERFILFGGAYGCGWTGLHNVMDCFPRKVWMIPTPSQQKKAMGPIHNLSAQTALDPNIMFYIKDIFTFRIKTYKNRIFTLSYIIRIRRRPQASQLMPAHRRAIVASVSWPTSI